MRVKVILEFDDNKLGQGWMNIDNLKLLLYTEQKTKEDLLKVVYYGEENRGGDKMIGWNKACDKWKKYFDWFVKEKCILKDDLPSQREIEEILPSQVHGRWIRKMIAKIIAERIGRRG